MLFWLLTGAMTLQRLAFRPQTPASLLPTLAIFSARAAVAGNAWFAISASDVVLRIDTVQQLIFGTFLLLTALQVLLIRLYLKVPFALGFWALTFTTVASGRYAIQFIAISAVPAAAVWQWIIALVATGIIALIAGASIRYVLGAKREAVGSR